MTYTITCPTCGVSGTSATPEAAQSYVLIHMAVNGHVAEIRRCA